MITNAGGIWEEEASIIRGTRFLLGMTSAFWGSLCSSSHSSGDKLKATALYAVKGSHPVERISGARLQGPALQLGG